MTVCKVKNRYLLTSADLSVQCDQGKNIYCSTSMAPTGPFLPCGTIFTIDDTRDGHYPFFYLPVAHPGFINERDEILVTYSINGYAPCLPGCVQDRMNPDHYRPKAIRVPLKLMGPDF